MIDVNDDGKVDREDLEKFANEYNISECDYSSILEEVDKFRNEMEIEDFYVIFKMHWDKCVQIIAHYKERRREIFEIEEKLRNSKFLKKLDINTEGNRKCGNIETARIDRLIKRYEKLLTKLKEISLDNIKRTMSLLNELLSVKKSKENLDKSMRNHKKLIKHKTRIYDMVNIDQISEKESDKEEDISNQSNAKNNLNLSTLSFKNKSAINPLKVEDDETNCEINNNLNQNLNTLSSLNNSLNTSYSKKFTSATNNSTFLNNSGYNKMKIMKIESNIKNLNKIAKNLFPKSQSVSSKELKRVSINEKLDQEYSKLLEGKDDLNSSLITNQSVNSSLIKSPKNRSSKTLNLNLFKNTSNHSNHSKNSSGYDFSKYKNYYSTNTVTTAATAKSHKETEYLKTRNSRDTQSTRSSRVSNKLKDLISKTDEISEKSHGKMNNLNKTTNQGLYSLLSACVTAMPVVNFSGLNFAKEYYSVTNQ